MLRKVKCKSCKEIKTEKGNVHYNQKKLRKK